MIDEIKLRNLFTSSQKLFAQQDFGGAIKILTQIIDYSPEFAPAFMNRGTAYLNLPKTLEKYSPTQHRDWLQQAISDLDKAIELLLVMSPETYRGIDGDKKVSYCYYQKADAQSVIAAFYPSVRRIDHDLLRQAVDSLNDAIRYNNHNDSAFRLKALICETHFDDPETAISLYSSAIAISQEIRDYLMRAWCKYLTDADVANYIPDYKIAKKLGFNISDIDDHIPLSARLDEDKNYKWSCFVNSIEFY